jgi:hypothetical protein
MNELQNMWKQAVKAQFELLFGWTKKSRKITISITDLQNQF